MTTYIYSHTSLGPFGNHNQLIAYEHDAARDWLIRLATISSLTQLIDVTTIREVADAINQPYVNDDEFISFIDELAKHDHETYEAVLSDDKLSLVIANGLVLIRESRHDPFAYSTGPTGEECELGDELSVPLDQYIAHMFNIDALPFAGAKLQYIGS